MHDILLPGNVQNMDYYKIHDVVHKSFLNPGERRHFIFTATTDDKIVVRGNFRENILNRFKYMKRTKIHKNNDIVSFYIRLRVTTSVNGKQLPTLDEKLDDKIEEIFRDESDSNKGGGLILYNFTTERKNIYVPVKKNIIPSVLIKGMGIIVDEQKFNERFQYGFGGPRSFGHGMMMLTS